MGCAQAVGKPAFGAAKGAVAIRRPLYDQRLATLRRRRFPQRLPLCLTELRVTVERLIEELFVGIG
ncbi:hypothetical protein D3C84_1152500 [compost metagenome]